MAATNLKSSFEFVPRTDLFTRVIDGRPRYFDKHGTEYDLFHRPMLGKSPEVQAQIKRMSDEAKLRSKQNTGHNKNAVTNKSEIAKLRDRQATLRDRIFDAGKVKTFYVNVQNEDVLHEWLTAVDKRMEKLRRYRNLLLDSLVVAELRVDQCDDNIHQANDEIEAIYKKIAELEAADKPEKEHVEKSLGMTVEKLMKKLDPRVLQQWLDAGIKLEDVVKMVNA